MGMRGGAVFHMRSTFATVEVVGVGIGQGLAGDAGGFGLVPPAEGLKTGLPHAAQRPLDRAARDEGGGDRPRLAACGGGRACQARRCSRSRARKAIWISLAD